MNGAVSIERVRDLEAVWSDLVALFLAFEDYNAGFLRRKLRVDWEQRWREHLALHGDRLILIARIDGEAVGYAVARIVRDFGLFDDEFVHVSDLFVRAPYRDQNIARAIVGQIEAWAREHDVESLRLEVFSANKPGVRFWTYSGYSLDSMTMTKTLRGAS